MREKVADHALVREQINKLSVAQLENRLDRSSAAIEPPHCRNRGEKDCHQRGKSLAFGVPANSGRISRIHQTNTKASRKVETRCCALQEEGKGSQRERKSIEIETVGGAAEAL